ncbi:MAG: GAF domain-containing protein [Candidatus Hydrogenedentes bacterium]|nr:GAF domain-containing protein [Candidatus Hydrogenedentota bacterium]
MIVRPQPQPPSQRPHETEYGRHSALNQHQMALRWLSRASAQVDDVVKLAQSFVEASEDIFDAVRCAVLLEQGDCVRVVASQGISPAITEPLRLSYASGLMRWFDEFACLIDRATVQRAPDAVKELQLLNARLAAPLLRGGRVFGAIVLGDKASGVSYSAEERELLTLMARCTAIAFERARSLQETARQQDRLDLVFERTPVGIATIGPDKTVLMINPEAESLLHVRGVDVSGRSIQKLGSAFADIVLRSLQSGQALLGEKIFDPATGQRLNLSVSPAGGRGAVVAFSRVVEEQTPTEDIAYSPFWEYLSARVAQEIKNPMVAINTFAQLLPRKHDSEDFRDAFSRVVLKEVSRINGVVETLFEFARNPKLTLQRSNLHETLQNALQTFEAELAAHAIELQTDWDPQADEAELDPIFFTQAVHNVVQNSIDAMPTGGVLQVRTQRQESETEISISDTGPGIPSEETGHIFLPFYSTREKGMGLGLPIASRIMRQHHGDLQVKQPTPRGACFILRLPRPPKLEMARRRQEEYPQMETSDINA